MFNDDLGSDVVSINWSAGSEAESLRGQVQRLDIAQRQSTET